MPSWRKWTTALVDWFDYQVVYRAFVWRFDKKFRENPAMRKAFTDQMIGWGIQREAEVTQKRKDTIKLVDD